MTLLARAAVVNACCSARYHRFYVWCGDFRVSYSHRRAYYVSYGAELNNELSGPFSTVEEVWKHIQAEQKRHAEEDKAREARAAACLDHADKLAFYKSLPAA